MLNDYFSTVFVHDSDNTFFDQNKKSDVGFTFENISVEANDASITIDKLDIAKAHDPDAINARIIKECKTFFVKIFTVIKE